MASGAREQRVVPRLSDGLGTDRTWPTAWTAGLVAVAYLALHGPPAPGAHAIAAGLAALYLGVLSVMAPAIVRRITLRLGGASGRVVPVARGLDDLASDVLPSRWRISAIIAGAAVSLAGTVAGAGLSDSLDPGTHVHAVAAVVLAVNAALLAIALVPTPGFTGWEFLLGLVDAACARPEQRVQRAARVARWVGTPVLGAGGAMAVLAGHPVLAIACISLAVMTWRRGGWAADQDASVRRQLAAGRDALVEFLCVHTAGEVARPAIHHVRSDEAVGAAPAGVRGTDMVSLVEADCEVIGVIGPRQRSERGATGPRGPYEAIMVPIASLEILEPGSPAVDILPEMARHGFALVSGAPGLAYVDPATLGRQVGSWVCRKAAPWA